MCTCLIPALCERLLCFVVIYGAQCFTADAEHWRANDNTIQHGIASATKAPRANSQEESFINVISAGNIQTTLKYRLFI